MSGHSVCWRLGALRLPGSNPAFSRGRQLVTFRFEYRLPVPEHRNKQQQTCISPEPGAKAKNGSEVKWAECSLLIGTGCWVQVFSLILDGSVGLWVGIQSAGDKVPWDFQVRILLSAEEDYLSPLDSNIAFLCQSIEINNKHVSRQSQVGKPKPAVKSSGLNAHSS